MPARTTPSQAELVLGALAKPDNWRLLSRLAHADATETELREFLELDKAVASRALSHLRMLGLIDRERTREKYSLVLPELTVELMRKATETAHAINERRAEADRARLAELEEAPTAQPPADAA